MLGAIAGFSFELEVGFEEAEALLGGAVPRGDDAEGAFPSD